MSKYSETILTASGLDLATRAANGKTKFSITKATATADDLRSINETDLQNLTKLPNEIQTGTITNKDENIPNSKAVIGTEILFTNEGINEGYSINAVGLYAKEEGKDEEILYALNTAIEPEFMPDFADKVILQFLITMYIIVGRTENVTVIVDPSGMASKEYVNTKIAEIDVNDKIQDVDIAKTLTNRLVYTENKSADMNNMTKVAEILGKTALGLKTTDSEGKVVPILPDSDGLIGISGINGDTSTGGGDTSTGGGDDSSHPSYGYDIYEGSLANGEFTERYVRWQGATDPTTTYNITFNEDVGKNMDKVGKGLQFIMYVKCQKINQGVKGDVTTIPFNYDPGNEVKEGCYTTMAPVPMNIRAGSFAVDKKLNVTFTGVGEGLSMKNHQSPGINVTLKADKTMDIESVQGFDNDGAAGGVTGYTYDVVVEIISTYSTQPSVQQLPNTINLFTGLSSGEIPLVGSTEFFENIPSGVEVTFDDYAYYSEGTLNNMLYYRFPLSDFNFKKVVKIPKEKLINNYNYDLNLLYDLNPSYLTMEIRATSNTLWNEESMTYHPKGITGDFRFEKGKIDIQVLTTVESNRFRDPVPFLAKVIQIKPY